MTHIESRLSKEKEYDFYIDCEASNEKLSNLLMHLKPIVISVATHSKSIEKNQS